MCTGDLDVRVLFIENRRLKEELSVSKKEKELLFK
jgi:hypothetical protein